MRKPYWILLVTTLISITILMLCIPRKTKLIYNCEIGKPWQYATLIADMNFTVKKSDSVFTQELDSAMKTYAPFYVVNEGVFHNEMSAFINDYQSGKFGKVPANYIKYIKNKLEEVYHVGIMTPQQMSVLMAEDFSSVNIINGNESFSVSLEKLFTTRTAYEYIMNADSLHIDHAILAQLAINNYLLPNLNYDKVKSSLSQNEIKHSVIRDKGPVMLGERIVDKGQMITPDIKEKIDSYQNHINEMRNADTSHSIQNIGQGACLLILLMMFALYLLIYRQPYVVNYQKVALFYALITIFPACTYLLIRYQILSPFLVPFAMIPLFIRVFFDSRTANMALLISLFMTAICLPNPFEFIFVETVMGFTSIYALKELSDRAQILRVALYITLVGLITQFVYDVSVEHTLTSLRIIRYTYIALSGIGILFAYPIMYMIERMFGFTSSVTLIELSNINNPILRRMSKVAQGTFNHSMTVSNLASEVANKIGANALLVRTGALYHDIGKVLNPAFFTENQTGVNPHDSLEEKDGLSKEERSAQIIIDHVVQGMLLAEKYHLPKMIKDFITTHHGKSQARYFYVVWQNNHPNEKPRTELFTYPGPNPFTKEQAILMMCDAIEASSRSLKEYTEESLTGLVNKIIDLQVSEGYFLESPITFRDIRDAKMVLIDCLKTIYHTRIAYPEMHKKKQSGRKSHRSMLLGSGFRSSRKNPFS